MLQECACGEPLVDNTPSCPQCHTPNPAYRPSRWRIFWPGTDTLTGAADAIQLGYWAAFAVAVVTTLGALGANKANLVDAVIYAILGWGIWRKWRVAAVLAFLIFLTNVVFGLAQGAGIGVLTVFIFVGLLNSVRGTFAYSRLSGRVSERAAG